MSLDPIAAATLAAGLGVLIGFLLRRQLARLSYRRTDEQSLPHPGPLWIIPIVTGLGAATISYRAAQTGRWDAAALALPVLTLGVWVAAVDADVQRLPFRQVAVLTLAQAAAIVTVAIATHNPQTAVLGALAGILTYLGFRLFHRLTRGGIGYGDVTLTAPLAAAVTTAGGLPRLWLWLIIALTAAALYNLALRKAGRHPLGPWLTLGALIALVP